MESETEVATFPFPSGELLGALVQTPLRLHPGLAAQTCIQLTAHLRAPEPHAHGRAAVSPLFSVPPFAIQPMPHRRPQPSLVGERDPSSGGSGVTAL